MAQGSLRRAAILIDSLDASTATKMLSMMPADRAAQVRKAVSELTDVDVLERKMALAEFMQKSHRSREQVDAAELVNTADHVDRAESQAFEQSHPTSTVANFLDSLPPQTLTEALANEHPQTIAIVLASMQPRSAANLLQSMSPELRLQSLRRLAHLDEVPPQALEDIGEQIKILVGASPERDIETGSKCLSSIVSHLRQDRRDEILAEFIAEYPDLHLIMPDVPAPASAERPNTAAHQGEPPPEPATAAESESPASEQSLDFGPVENLPADALRRVLSHVDTNDAILSLCGMRPRTVQRLLALLPKSQRNDVNTRLKAVSNLELRDIDRAQQRVWETALMMSERGRLPELRIPNSAARFRMAA